eukprot:6173903-Pleurochrysis_carterae.AAC.1
MARGACGCLKVKQRKAPGGERRDSARRRAARGGQRKTPSCESGIAILYCRQNSSISANKQDVALCVSHDFSERRSTRRVTVYCAAATRQFAVDCTVEHTSIARREKDPVSQISGNLVSLPATHPLSLPSDKSYAASLTWAEGQCVAVWLRLQYGQLSAAQLPEYQSRGLAPRYLRAVTSQGLGQYSLQARVAEFTVYRKDSLRSWWSNGSQTFS